MTLTHTNKIGLSLLSTGLLVVLILCAGCAAEEKSQDARVVFAMGYGSSNTYYSRYIRLGIPSLVIYDDGLVIHRCGKGLEDMAFCQTWITTTRVEQFTADIARAEKFSQDCWVRMWDRYGTGPTVRIKMQMNTRTFCGGLHWWMGQPRVPSESITDNFIAEIQNDKDYQPYKPKRVSVVVTWGDDPRQRSDMLRGSQDVRTTPAWPYEFSPLPAADECEYLEQPMPVEEATSTGGFRVDSTHYFNVILLPYLPGEEERKGCRSDISDYYYYQYLPFYEETNWKLNK